MKRLFTLFVSLLIIAGMISSCKKDSSEPDNEFTVGTESYVLDTLGLYYNGSVANGYIYYADIISPGIIVGSDYLFLNSGSFIELVIITPSSDGIATGEYTYSSSGSDAPSMTINQYSCYCESWSSGSSNTYVDIASGTLNVTRDGSDYIFSFTGTDENGTAVSAYFHGEGLFIDFSNIKSEAHSGIN